MKKLNISDELFSRFVDGKTTPEEDEQITQLMAEDPELMDEFIAISKASQLADHTPLNEPNVAEAQQQIAATLQNRQLNASRTNRPNPFLRKRFYWAAAAIALVLIASTFVVLLHHSPTPQSPLAKQQGSSSTSPQEQTEQQPILSDTNSSSEYGSTMPPSQNTGSDTRTSPAAPNEPSAEDFQIGKFEEKHYADMQVVNYLNMVKPNKSSYSISWTNPDRLFVFEWHATNVETLHFTVTDSKGKTVAETKDITANQFSLKYGDIYPEQKFLWRLVVVFKDGTQDMRNGQVQINYLPKK